MTKNSKQDASSTESAPGYEGAFEDLGGVGGQMSEQNKAIVRRAVESFDRHDLDALNEVVAEDVTWHGGSFGEITGREPFKAMVASFYAAFPDLRIHAEDLIADRDVVAARWTTTGTHEGDLMGIPATGKQARWGEQPIYRIAEGKISEVWWVGDAFGLMQQLGAIPSGQEASA